MYNDTLLPISHFNQHRNFQHKWIFQIVPQQVRKLITLILIVPAWNKSRSSPPWYLYNLLSSFNLLLLVPFLRRFSMRLQVLNVGLSFFLFLDSLAPFRAATICDQNCSPPSKPGIVGMAGIDGTPPPPSSTLPSKFSPWPRVRWIKDDKASGTTTASFTWGWPGSSWMRESSGWAGGRAFSGFLALLAWRVSRADSSDDDESELEDEEGELEPEVESSNLRLGIPQLRWNHWTIENRKKFKWNWGVKTLITFRYRQLEWSEALAAGRVVRSFLFPTFKQLRNTWFTHLRSMLSIDIQCSSTIADCFGDLSFPIQPFGNAVVLT